MDKPYLTEARLVEILKELYGAENVTTQVKRGRRRVDAVVELPFLDCPVPKIRDLIGEDSTWGIGSEVESEGLIQAPDTVQVDIEFDGHYHYLRNSVAYKEHPGFKFFREDVGRYSLRIPYWVQPDENLMYFLFGVAKDFSRGYPHGFVSPKCMLPDHFCFTGESRFFYEMSMLPPDISLQVCESLIKKSEEKRPELVGSHTFWYELLTDYDDGPRGALVEKINDVRKVKGPSYVDDLAGSEYDLWRDDPIMKFLYRHVSRAS